MLIKCSLSLSLSLSLSFLPIVFTGQIICEV